MGSETLINSAQLCDINQAHEYLPKAFSPKPDLGLWLEGFSVSGQLHWDPKSHNVELSLLTIAEMR